MLSCKSGAGTLHLIPTLINHGPSILTSSDISGNTALHHASAAGELKALRMLLQYGANPLASNAYSWTPVHYSATPAAEAYFKTLIIDFEKTKAEHSGGEAGYGPRGSGGAAQGERRCGSGGTAGAGYGVVACREEESDDSNGESGVDFYARGDEAKGGDGGVDLSSHFVSKGV
jgi:hypothetical protein